MLSAAFKGLIVLKENIFMSIQNVYSFNVRHTWWYLKNFCSAEYKRYEQVFLLFYLPLNCLLMGHLAIMRMWFTLTPLWPLTSVPCCGFEGFSGTMSRLHWLWFSASIELVLSNVTSPHFSLLRKEISMKKDIQFRRQHIHMYLTWGGGILRSPQSLHVLLCCSGEIGWYGQNICHSSILLSIQNMYHREFFFFCHWLNIWRLHNVHIPRCKKLGLRSDSHNWDSILLPVLSYSRFCVCSCFQNSLAIGYSVLNLNENQGFLFSQLG